MQIQKNVPEQVCMDAFLAMLAAGVILHWGPRRTYSNRPQT
jgi:hypothetical protein